MPVIDIEQIHLPKSKVKFCVDWNSARFSLEISNSGSLCQWHWLERKFNAIS